MITAGASKDSGRRNCQLANTLHCCMIYTKGGGTGPPACARRILIATFRGSGDGHCFYFTAAPEKTLRDFLLWRGHAWVILAIVLPCYLLARYLTTTVRDPRPALEKLGQADLPARANADPRDEPGEPGRNFNEMAGKPIPGPVEMFELFRVTRKRRRQPCTVT